MAIKELFRWGMKSVGGLAANIALLTLWVDGVGIAPEIAIGINWVLVSLVGYLVTDRWVFESATSPNSLKGHVKQYLGMQGVMSGSKAINYVIYAALIQLSVDYRIAWVSGAIVVFFGTFLANRRLWNSEIAQSS